MSALTLEENHVAEATMNAVIIYNNSLGAAKAKVMLERASHRADASLRWAVKPFRLDLLSRPGAAHAALAAASDAHLMLIVLRHPLWIPSTLRNWLERWASQRQVPDAALAVWNGAGGDTLSPAAAPDLSRFAARHGLSFISDLPIPPREEPDVIEFARSEREASPISNLQEMLEKAIGPGYEGAANS
jgi:hypothetical protein